MTKRISRVRLEVGSKKVKVRTESKTPRGSSYALAEVVEDYQGTSLKEQKKALMKAFQRLFPKTFDAS